MELRPFRVADRCDDRESNRRAPVARRLARSDLEAEPVGDVASGSLAELRLCDLERLRAVDVDVDRGADADLARQQSSCAVDDAAAVDEVEPLQQPVVGDLELTRFR